MAVIGVSILILGILLLWAVGASVSVAASARGGTSNLMTVISTQPDETSPLSYLRERRDANSRRMEVRVIGSTDTNAGGTGAFLGLIRRSRQAPSTAIHRSKQEGLYRSLYDEIKGLGSGRGGADSAARWQIHEPIPVRQPASKCRRCGMRDGCGQRSG